MVKTGFVALMMMFMLAGCGGETSSPATLVAITVTPTIKSIAPGTTTQFSALGIYSDNSAQNLTASVTWSSANSSVATVSDSQGSKGLARAVMAGSVAITATSGGISGSATLTSSALASIAVTPVNPASIVGTTQQFRATGVLANNASQDLTALVNWSSLNTAAATISTNGVATAVGAGSSSISATFADISGTTTLTTLTVVSIAVVPANPTIAVGSRQQFSASATLSNAVIQDVTSLVSWNSTNTAVATISSKGFASSVSPGSTTIGAALAGVSGSTTLTVQGPSSITITPANPSAVAGSTLQFTATGTFSDGSVHDLTMLAVWSSSNGGVATISNSPASRGLATAVASGSTTVSAILGVSGSTVLAVKTLKAIAVAPLNPTMGLGSTLQLIAKGTFSDSSSQDITASVAWASQNTAIATVSNVSGSKGVVTANALGSTVITAKLGVFSVSTALNVFQGNRAYVVNSGSNNLSVIDTSGNSVVATLPVGSSPQGIAANAATNRAYVTNSGSSSLSVIDTTSNTVVATVPVGSTPRGVAVNAATNRAYVANSGSSSLSVIDTTSNTVVATLPVGGTPQWVVVNAATNRVYVTNSGSGSLSVIDTTGNTVIAIISVGVAPQRIALDAATNRAYVTNGGSSSLSVIDTSSNTVVATLPVGSAPQGVAVNAATNQVYVVNSGSSSLTVINKSDNTIVTTLSVGSTPQGVAVNAATNRAYVTNSGNGSISVVDTISNTVVATIAVGTVPRDVSLVP